MYPQALNIVAITRCLKNELLIFSTVNTWLINDLTVFYCSLINDLLL